MRRIRAGQLRNNITIQVNTESRDTYGGVTNSWATHITCWASINPVSGSEHLGGEKVRSERIYEFICRADSSMSSITTDMRISWNSRTFDIQEVLEFEERGWDLKISAIERDV